MSEKFSQSKVLIFTKQVERFLTEILTLKDSVKENVLQRKGVENKMAKVNHEPVSQNVFLTFIFKTGGCKR